MELTGDLSDFALADILQILGITRKTGTLSLDAGGREGRVVIEEGRVTHASLQPGETLADRLVREKRITAEVLARLREFSAGPTGIWDLRTLLVESGLLTSEEIESAASKHIQEIIGCLVGLDKGRFGIELNHAQAPDGECDAKLSEGLEVGEVLLGAAKESDEEGMEREASLEWLRENEVVRQIHSFRRNETRHESVLFRGDGPDRGVWSRTDNPARLQNDPPGSLLCSLLGELRSYSFEAEVSLLMLRYASEVATRGILFVVRDEEIRGLGQFGIDGRGASPDQLVREIRIPTDVKSVLGIVARSREAYIGEVPDGYWNSELLSKIGGRERPLSMFAVPIICNDRAMYMVYGDNYPGQARLGAVQEFVALANQAGVVLEKMSLERRLELLNQEGVA